MPVKNRLLELTKGAPTLNGIDFVEVRQAEPTHVFVHFINELPISPLGLIATIEGGDVQPTVTVAPIQPDDFTLDADGKPLLTLEVPGFGDHSLYTLKLEYTGGAAASLDPYFSSARFSFYAFCPSPDDCSSPGTECPDLSTSAPSIDYLAKDFNSFLRALSDFSSQRYPEWQERSEADFGIMMMEALSAIGDELSYIQDAHHRQANIETVTERRSLVRLSRTVDYEPAPLLTATTWVSLKVTSDAVPAGTRLGAKSAEGSDISYLVGTGINDQTNYLVNPRWNELSPYWWDDGDRCLPVGATSMWIDAKGLNFKSGQKILIDTLGESSADAPIRQIVTLDRDASEVADPLFGRTATHVSWRPEDRLLRYHDLQKTRIAANIVPVIQGERFTDGFAIPDLSSSASPAASLAIARVGPNNTGEAPAWTYLHTLENAPLAYSQSASHRAEPEILVRSKTTGRRWKWVRTMLDAGYAEECFTIDPESYRLVANLESGAFWDYDGSGGATIRFGDGEFGRIPAPGEQFVVDYLTSLGSSGNVPYDSITELDDRASSVVDAANPLASAGGVDPESDEQVRRTAPYKFQSVAFRAVRASDYEEAARRLDWVQQAGCVFRWTGSWPTVFCAADPRGVGELSDLQHLELVEQLNRFRLAGYEAYAPAPVYATFDLNIRVCAKSDAFSSDVGARIRRALDPVRRGDGSTGFFHFDNFSFGTDFLRSRLEACIQSVDGVDGVRSIRYRRRGLQSVFQELPAVVKFGPGEIFRLDNNNDHPDHGTYRLEIGGGK